jgi:hypothetical protein
MTDGHFHCIFLIPMDDHQVGAWQNSLKTQWVGGTDIRKSLVEPTLVQITWKVLPNGRTDGRTNYF